MIKQPSELHPELTDERIDMIANLISRVRVENIETADERDNGWSLGCRAYGWCCSEIKTLSDTAPWLEVINPTLKFIFSIGGVEVSMYKGAPDKPKENITSRAQSYPELRQISFLSDFEIPEKLVWAFAVETDMEGLVTNIVFFAMDEIGNIIASRSTPLHNVVSNIYSIEPTDSAPTNLPPAPVTLPGAEKDKKDINNE